MIKVKKKNLVLDHDNHNEYEIILYHIVYVIQTLLHELPSILIHIIGLIENKMELFEYGLLGNKLLNNK
jgi:hypothetical protein